MWNAYNVRGRTAKTKSSCIRKINLVSPILVTGSAGCIGRAAVAELRKTHPVRGFDLRPCPDGLDDEIVADLTDRDALDRACRGVEAVVHLAAVPDVADFHEKLLGPNIVGVVNIFEAARSNEVSRIVVASSGQVVHGYPRDVVWTPELLPEPRNLYAATKVFAEAVGKVYAHTHGMSVIAARLGWVPRDQRHIDEFATDEWAHQVYLSPGDAGRFFRACVEAKDIPFEILYASSIPPRYTVMDIESARQRIGYEPRDTWPEGCDQLA